MTTTEDKHTDVYDDLVAYAALYEDLRERSQRIDERFKNSRILFNHEGVLRELKKPLYGKEPLVVEVVPVVSR